MGLIMHCGVPYSGGLDNAITELDRTARTETNTDFGLSDTIQNYDLILFQAYYTASNVYIGSSLLKVSDLLDANRSDSFWIVGGDLDRSIKVQVTDDTHYQIVNSTKSCGIYGVYGIKIGTGESKNFKNLWNYVEDNSGSVLFGTYIVSLKDRIENYDDIIIENMSSSSDSGDWDATNQFRLNVESLSKNKNPYRFSYTSFDNRSSTYYIKGAALQKIKDNANNTNGLVNVYGIKYPSGANAGTNVIANPDGTPTGTLNKIQIGGEIYNVNGGESGGTAAPIKTVLYNTSTTTTNIEIVLNDDISNYDELEFVTGFTNNDLSESYYRCTVSDFKAKYPYTGSTSLNNPQLIVSLYGSNYVCFQCGSTNNRIYIVRSSSSRLIAINGLKYAEGGGGGSIDYSTTETKIGKWIDGKDIYRIVLDYHENPLTGNQSIDVGALKIETLVNSNALGTDNSGGYTGTKWSLNSVSSNSGRLIYMSNATTLKVEGSFYKHWIILEYTKRPDTYPNVYAVDGNVEASNIEKYENTSGAIIVTPGTDSVLVTSTNGNNGAYGAKFEVTNYNYAVLEVASCTAVYSVFGIGSQLTYSAGGTQTAKTTLSSQTGPYRFVVNISSYSGFYYLYLSCGGNASHDITAMYLTENAVEAGPIT